MSASFNSEQGRALDPAKVRLPLLLEHVNLNISDEVLARSFYVNGLAGSLNPVSTNHRQVHINLGLCQFHLPYRLSVKEGEKVSIPQVWPGKIKVWTAEGVHRLARRLKDNEELSNCRVEELSEDRVTITGPFGNIFELETVVDEEQLNLLRQRGGHVEPEDGAGMLLGLKKLIHKVKIGSADSIARFYQLVMGFPVSVSLDSNTGNTMAQITFGGSEYNLPEQHLVFCETEDAPPLDSYNRNEASAYHICLYCSSQDHFEEVFWRAKRMDLLYINKRFEGGPIEFASADTIDLARKAGQFRIKNLVDPKSAKDSAFLVLEHEIRSPSHRSCPIDCSSLQK